MPRKPPTPEEKALKKQVEDLIKNIKGTDKPAVDIDRAIKLFEKAQSSITQALAVLKGEEIVEVVDPNKKRAGRPKKVVEGTDGDLFTGDSAASAEAEGAPATPTARKKKGAAVADENA